MTEPDDSSSLKDLDARLKEAQSRQRAAKEREKGKEGRATGTGLGLGLRIAVDLVAARSLLYRLHYTPSTGQAKKW